MSLTKIGSIGINTGIQLAGVTTVATLHVGSGVTLSSDGEIFATGVSTFSGNVSVNGLVASGSIEGGADLIITDSIVHASDTNTKIRFPLDDTVTVETGGTQRLRIEPAGNVNIPQNVNVSGVVTATSFSGSGANLTGIDTDLVSDTTPQLGGNLDVNTKNIQFGDSGSSSDDRLTFGSSLDLSIYHGSNVSHIAESGTGPLRISTDEFQLMNVAQDETMIYAAQNLGVSLNYNNSTKLATIDTGVNITGACNATTFTGSGSGLTALPISNDANNRLITATGSSTLNGEERLTYDGNGIFNITGTGAAGVFVITPDTVDGGIYFNDGSSNKGALTYLHTNETMNFRVNGSNKLTINSSGNLVLNSGSGIDFSATSDSTGTASSEVFDDYEEGSFTPTLTCQDSALSASYNTQDGVYTKIGNFVHFQIYIRLSSKSGGSGHLRINGLPFTSSAASGAAYGGGVTAYTYNQSGSSAFDRLMIGSGSTQVQLFNGLNNGTNSNAGAGNLNNDTQLRVFGSYRV